MSTSVKTCAFCGKVYSGTMHRCPHCLGTGDPTAGDRADKRKGIIALAVIGGLIAVVAVAALIGSGGDTAPRGSADPVLESETVEYKLAVVDEGGYVPPDDPVVAQYRATLDVLEDRCYQNSRQRIGDMVVSIRDQFAERGVTTSLLTILLDVADPEVFALLEYDAQNDPGIPAASKKGDCAAYLTMYLLRMT